MGRKESQSKTVFNRNFKNIIASKTSDGFSGYNHKARKFVSQAGEKD
jgi:hypothetical protein